MSNSPFLHVVGEDDEDGPKISFAVHSWRRIVRDALTNPALESLPCKKDLYLVALDFSSLCDHRGQGSYSAKERRGRALAERPDPSLCELVEISDKQVSKMLKLLTALGFLRMTQKAAMGRQAEYEVTLPKRGIAETGECLAVAAHLGFKPAESAQVRSQRTRKARETQRLNRAHEVARMVVDEPVDNPVEGGVLGGVQTPLSGECAHTPSGGCPDTPSGGCAHTPPLPLGSLGNTGTLLSHLSTVPGLAGTAAEKDGSPEEAEHDARPDEPVDRNPSPGSWQPAVTQSAIRRRDKKRAEATRAGADPCPGLGEADCPTRRPVSPVNGEGLCVRCYGLFLTQGGADQDAGASDHEDPVGCERPPPADPGADGGTPA